MLNESNQTKGMTYADVCRSVLGSLPTDVRDKVHVVASFNVPSEGGGHYRTCTKTLKNINASQSQTHLKA